MVTSISQANRAAQVHHIDFLKACILSYHQIDNPSYQDVQENAHIAARLGAITIS